MLHHHVPVGVYLVNSPLQSSFLSCSSAYSTPQNRGSASSCSFNVTDIIRPPSEKRHFTYIYVLAVSACPADLCAHLTEAIELGPRLPQKRAQREARLWNPPRNNPSKWTSHFHEGAGVPSLFPLRRASKICCASSEVVGDQLIGLVILLSVACYAHLHYLFIRLDALLQSSYHRKIYKVLFMPPYLRSACNEHRVSLMTNAPLKMRTNFFFWTDSVLRFVPFQLWVSSCVVQRFSWKSWKSGFSFFQGIRVLFHIECFCISFTKIRRKAKCVFKIRDSAILMRWHSEIYLLKYLYVVWHTSWSVAGEHCVFCLPPSDSILIWS